uniref:Uncharacterized protein n=1 Tax=Phytophthora ramorum TaxID=164328 RepID=H3HAW8_PHYRM
MPDPIEQYRKQQLYRRVYEKRVEAIAARQICLSRDNALREEIERNMKSFVATSLQCRYRGWKGRCIAACKRQRRNAAIAISRIIPCPLCKSICSHDPVTGEILGPGETQQLILQQAKEAKEELHRQKEEALYVGDFHARDKSFDGLGELIYVNGGRYAGQWKDNRRQGKGIYQSADGYEYIGDWVDGRKHGVGIQTLSSGERYIGHFVEGKLHGTGVYYAANGDRYEADGEVYKGHWERDYRHGTGVCFYPNGAVYSGEWWRGRWSGNGIYVSSEGIKYIGTFSKDKQHGKGKLLFENGDVFDGHFVHGVAQGSGKTKGIYRFYDSGNVYVGDWVANKRHGNGTYTFVGGSSYTGAFIDDHVGGR